MITAQKKTIVIAGGGVAGHRIAFALQRQANVVLVDPKEYFEVPMAAPRMLVEPGRARHALLRYAEFLPGVRHVRGRITEVHEDRVATDAGSIPFDYLVLATGSSYPDDLVKAIEGDAAGRERHYADWAGRIRHAKSIAILGGGPVGVELAAEILEEQPGKDLTLMHTGTALLESTTTGPQRYAEGFLRNRGAKIVLGRQADVDADLTIRCFGYRIDVSYLRNLSGALDPQGRVAVTPSLSLPGHPNIFAAGDITALPELKLGIWAGKHAKTVIANLRALLQNPARAKLRTYNPATGNRMMLVTLGRRHGAGHVPVFGDFSNAWLARKLKSEDVFIGRYRKGVGLL